MKITAYKLKRVNPKNNSHIFYKVQFRDPRTGKPTTRNGFTGKREAKVEVMEEISRLMQDDFTDNPNITFSKVAEKWLNNKRHTVAGATYCKYKSQYENHLKVAFKDKPIINITLDDCQQLVFDYADKYKRWDKLIGTFSSVFRFALKYGITKNNPFDRVERPKIEHDNEPKSLAVDEYPIFKEAINKHYRENNYKAFTFLWILALTGLRKGELSGLHWNDVDLTSGFIYVRKAITRDYDGKLVEAENPKNKYYIRSIPIMYETNEILKKWRKSQHQQLEKFNINTYEKPDQLVFTSQNGGILSPSKPRKWLNVITKKYGLTKISPHGLRHTFATVLANKNVSSTVIASEMGHKDTTITNKIYVDLRKVQDHNTSKLLEDL